MRTNTASNGFNGPFMNQFDGSRLTETPNLGATAFFDTEFDEAGNAFARELRIYDKGGWRVLTDFEMAFLPCNRFFGAFFGRRNRLGMAA